LVDNKGGIKISDFGISKKVESSESSPISLNFGLTLRSSQYKWARGSEPTVTPRICLLDGSGSSQANWSFLQSRYLECRMFSGRDVDRFTPLARPQPASGNVPSTSPHPFLSKANSRLVNTQPQLCPVIFPPKLLSSSIGHSTLITLPALRLLNYFNIHSVRMSRMNLRFRKRLLRLLWPLQLLLGIHLLCNRLVRLLRLGKLSIVHVLH